MESIIGLSRSKDLERCSCVQPTVIVFQQARTSENNNSIEQVQKEAKDEN